VWQPTSAALAGVGSLISPGIELDNEILANISVAIATLLYSAYTTRAPSGCNQEAVDNLDLRRRKKYDLLTRPAIAQPLLCLRAPALRPAEFFPLEWKHRPTASSEAPLFCPHP
jgi:hypothetical protein